jgi:hypothetical protein
VHATVRDKWRESSEGKKIHLSCASPIGPEANARSRFDRPILVQPGAEPDVVPALLAAADLHRRRAEASQPPHRFAGRHERWRLPTSLAPVRSMGLDRRARERRSAESPDFALRIRPRAA